MHRFITFHQWGPDTYHFGLGWYDGAAELHLGKRILRFAPDPGPREMKAQGDRDWPEGWWLALAPLGLALWALLIVWLL